MYDQATLTEILRFAGVRPGMTVIDVYPGAGDWTNLFSGRVGADGQVISFVPTEITDIKPDQAADMETLVSFAGLDNVQVASADLVAVPGATSSADIVWLHLFYHDLHTPLIQRRGATPTQFNAAVFDKLKSGGSFVIVDHAAALGSGIRDTASLHRIEPASVHAEVEAAGFVLAAESSVLANVSDPHATKVFDETIKGATDRFAYRFVKP
jgi:predicted methyltransferase